MSTIHFPKHPELAQEVAAWMASNEVRPTTFGKLAIGDPSLVATLQAGRELRRDTIRNIRHFMLTGKPKKAREGVA